MLVRRLEFAQLRQDTTSWVAGRGHLTNPPYSKATVTPVDTPSMSELPESPTPPAAPPDLPVVPVAPLAKRPEIGGPKGLEPTRYGDWESKGRCIDF